jgi:YHS domain-containing protein
VTGWVLRLLFVLAVVWALWRLLKGVLEGFASGSEQPTSKSAVKLVRDPVCGVFVSPATALPARARGETAYFCSEKCRSAWESR